MKNYNLTNKSVEDINLDSIFKGKKINILYTDPPWNNFKFWTTLAYKQTGHKLTPTNNEFIANFLNKVATQYLDGYFFLEIGRGMDKMTISTIFEGLYNFLEYDVLYKSGSKWLPSKIYVASSDHKYYFKDDLTNIKCNGPILPQACIGSVAKEGGIVYDPFCGLGNTTKATIKNNMIFYGNEFNKKRLLRTKEILDKHYEKTSN